MIEAIDISIQFGGRKLFEGVNLRFLDENCYGIIGANGAGKTTFLKVLSRELEPTKGRVILPEGQRMAVLKQDHFSFEEYTVLNAVYAGYPQLYSVMAEKEALYAKDEKDLTDDEGMRLGELEGLFAELNGWEAEPEAATLLDGLGIHSHLHNKKMTELNANQKVKVLLAQALFGQPDVLLLDEPTNHLDIRAINWLENFILDYPKTVLVVSHDRHFLNKVCTHIADIDYGKINLYVGNYDFWKESSELALRIKEDANKRLEDKANELKTFIQRFSANASKARQATSRKKLLEKITLDDIRPSSRKYPYINFKPLRESGKEIINVEHISKTINGKKVINDISFLMMPGEKIAFVGTDDLAKTVLFQILAGEMEPDEGKVNRGSTITIGHLPKDNSSFFNDKTDNLVDWLRRFSEDKTEYFIRGFLGRMLFSGDEVLKQVNVLSGGEKMRLVYSKIMVQGGNMLLIDGPTEHLDLESITSVNKALEEYTGNLIFATHDHAMIESVATRIMEITPKGLVDKSMSYNDYLDDAELQAQIELMYEE